MFSFTGFGLMQCDIIAIDFRFGLDAGFDLLLVLIWFYLRLWF